MRPTNLWLRAQNIQIQTSEDIVPGFDIGFDPKIPPETQNELRSVVKLGRRAFQYTHYSLGRF